MADKRPQILTAEQRELLTTIPHNLSESDLFQYFTLKQDDFEFIHRQRGSRNRLGIAIQLCVLRYIGRPLTDLPGVPQRALTYVASQLTIEPAAFSRYGERMSTVYEHLERIQQQYGYRDCDWPTTLQLARRLMPLALETDAALPLIEMALRYMQSQMIIAPAISTTEGLVWRIQRVARRFVYQRLTEFLAPEQERELDSMLVFDDEIGLTRLAWLRVPAKKPSPESIFHLEARLEFIRALQLPKEIPAVYSNRLRQLANRCRHYQAQPLSRFDARRRRAFLVAYLIDLLEELTDQLLDMFDKVYNDLMRRGRNDQKHRLYNNVTRLNRAVNTFVVAFDAFLEAREQGADPFEAVFAVVTEDKLTETLDTARTHMRPADMDYRDLLFWKYAIRRKSLLEFFRSLEFESVRGTDPALEALDYVVNLEDEHNKRVRAVEQSVKGETFTAPLDHLKRTRWKRHALDGEAINPHYYEMAAFQRLKEGLRSGDIAVKGSRRYQDFESYLLPESEWQRLKESGDTRLDVDDVDTYLQERQERIADLLSQLQRSLEAEDGPISLDKDGSLSLEKLDRTTTDAAEAWSKKLYRYMPWVQLSELLIEVDGWTNFMQAFTHLTSGETPSGTQKEILVAALMGLGMNLGLAKLAQASDYSYQQLSLVADWHLREETLQEAMATLDNFVLYQPFSQHWGRGTITSSDGMRVPVTVETANAVLNARYFGYRRGVTIVTHSADIWMPFSVTITNDVREALYVIDALCSNETDFDIQEHHTDHGGYTYHVFALSRMLGFRFAPRIRAITEQYLFTVEPIAVVEPLEHLMKGVADETLIRENWDGMRRLAASIGHRTVSAALIMRKLASYPRQNQLALAFNEVGKLERTEFALEFMLDKTFRQRSRQGLNKGESIHSLARALSSIGQGGELSERELLAQMNRASSLMLLVSAIAAWNTVYLDKAVATLRGNGVDIPDEYLRHVSPLKWGHVNLLGKYNFDLSQTFPLDGLRPLHMPKNGL